MRNVKYDTRDLWQKDRDHYIHPWTDFATFKETGSDVIAEGDLPDSWNPSEADFATFSNVTTDWARTATTASRIAPLTTAPLICS